MEFGSAGALLPEETLALPDGLLDGAGLDGAETEFVDVHEAPVPARRQANARVAVSAAGFIGR